LLLLLAEAAMTALLVYGEADELTRWDALSWGERQANIVASWSGMAPAVARARLTVVETLLAVIDIELGEMQNTVDRIGFQDTP
jgi:hypothetical protein